MILKVCHSVSLSHQEASSNKQLLENIRELLYKGKCDQSYSDVPAIDWMYHSNGEHNSNHPTRSSSLIAFKELHLQEGSTNTNEDFAESCWLSRPAAQVFQMSATLAADVSKCILYPNFMELQFLQPPPLPHPPNSSTPRWSAIPIVTSGITSSKTNRL